MDEGNKDWSVLIKSLTAYEGFQTDDSLITRGEWMPDYTFYSPRMDITRSHLVTRTTFDLGENKTYIHLSFCVERFTSTILWPIFLPTLLSKLESRWRQKSKKDFYIFLELSGAE